MKPGNRFAWNGEIAFDSNVMVLIPTMPRGLRSLADEKARLI